MRQRWSGLCDRAILGALLACLMVGCGGGGGRSSPAPAPATGGSGLLPDAPIQGAILHTDATLLRVLADGAVQTFRGWETPTGLPRVYSNVVRQARVAGGIVESASNALNAGANTGTPVFVDSGTIKRRESVRFFAGGKAEVLEITELRSPVRSGDRWVTFDRHIDDSGVDFDGDGVKDAADVAVWSQVVGEELLDLPQRAQVQAVRVDTVWRTRVLPSGTGRNTPVSDTIVSRWYAPGLGLVKLRSDMPNGSPVLPRWVHEETLDALDAGSRGLGATEPALQRVPLGTLPGDVALGLHIGAEAFDDHAVVLTYIPGQSMAAGFMLSRLDGHGHVTASQIVTWSQLGVSGGVDLRLLKAGGGLRVLWYGAVGVQMLAVDAEGRTLSASPVTLVPGRLNPDGELHLFQAVSTSETIWLSWMNASGYPNADDLPALHLRRFNSSGLPLAQSVILAEGPSVSVSGVRAAARGEQAVWSWVRGTSNDHPVWQYAVVGTGSSVASHVLPAFAADAPCGWNLRPHFSSSGAAFTCSGDRGENGMFRLDATFAPIADAFGLPRLRPLLPAELARGQGSLPLPDGDAPNALLLRQFTTYWPEDASSSAFWLFVELPALDAAYSAANLRTMARIPGQQLASAQLLELSDRWLLVGGDCSCQGGQMLTLVVWR